MTGRDRWAESLVTLRAGTPAASLGGITGKFEGGKATASLRGITGNFEGGKATGSVGEIIGNYEGGKAAGALVALRAGKLLVIDSFVRW